MNSRLLSSSKQGFKSGFKTWWWIARITLCVTFCVAILQWSGAIDYFGEWVSPFLAYFGLGGEAAVVFITTALTNVYASIGCMATLSVDFREATLLAVMGLIAHNMVVETIIQKKSGASATVMVLLRVLGALFAAFMLNWILPADYSGTLILESDNVATDLTFMESMTKWALNMAYFIPLMFVIIVGLNAIQQILREFNIINIISKPFVPFMALFGLRGDSSITWLVLNTLGLAYGGSIMITERESGALSLRESKLLNTHIALSHSLLEDTLLYFAIGIPLLILIVPRLVMAIIAVWIQRIYYRIKK